MEGLRGPNAEKTGDLVLLMEVIEIGIKIEIQTIGSNSP
jgi:hypothetical protein